LKIKLRKAQYRVLKHGTLAKPGLPSFHTQNKPLGLNDGTIETATSNAFSAEPDTVFSNTEAPAYRTQLYRVFKHAPTALRYTEVGANTVISYTRRLRNSAHLLGFPTDNYLKLSSKLYNRRVDVFSVTSGDVR
jgi:hypothetical protein